MSEQITLDGKEYTSSKRASQLSGYTQDYVGQLARGGQVDAQRVGGLWYVSMDSLLSYKKDADAYVPVPPRAPVLPVDPDAIVTFDGKDYVSASRAAKLTSYHQDYIGQLARSGTILARQIGNRWYVDREGLLAHKTQKDALLAAVQAESVGIKKAKESVSEVAPEEAAPFFTYTRGVGDLLPDVKEKEEAPADADEQETEYAIPIHVQRSIRQPVRPQRVAAKAPEPALSSKRTSYAGLVGAALTVVIVLSFGIVTLQKYQTFAAVSPTRSTFSANVAQAVTRVGDVLEKMFVPELVYQRSSNLSQ